MQCVYLESLQRFPLPAITYDTTSLDPDLSCILGVYANQDTPSMIFMMYVIDSEVTPGYFQWISNALLHLSWAKQNTPDTFNLLVQPFWIPTSKTIPLNAVLNRLLTSCIFLCWPIKEELLRVHDKRYTFPFPASLLLTLLFFSDKFDQILSQFSQAIAQAIHTSHPYCGHLPGLLNHL